VTIGSRPRRDTPPTIHIVTGELGARVLAPLLPTLSEVLAVMADGRIAHINTTLSHWLGLRAEPARPLNLLDILSPDAAASVKATMRSAGVRVRKLDVDLLRRMAAHSRRSSFAAGRVEAV
jgi:hypothetical protein